MLGGISCKPLILYFMSVCSTFISLWHRDRDIEGLSAKMNIYQSFICSCNHAFKTKDNQSPNISTASQGRVSHISCCLSSVTQQGNTSMPCSQGENGFVSSFSLFPEKVVQELLQSPVQGSDDHLIEFSEALRSMIIFCSNY